MNRTIRCACVLIVTLSLMAAAVPRSAKVGAGTSQTYVVLYKGTSVPSDAAKKISSAGGTLVYSYSQIGVAIATSSNAAFSANLLKDSKVEGAVSTAGFGSQLDTEGFVMVDAVANSPAPGSDPLSPLQWDMNQIHTLEAHEITGGSSSVLVGDIDTGLDYTHPDLAPNVDFANSVSCVGGVPNTAPAAWDDDNGHGTHTAGTIAAALNGIGIVGVAPNVRIAAIKAGNADGYFFPEAVICAFMWAGSHGFDVTNNSYFADPWLYNCRNDPVQRAIWKAEQRAIKYAMHNNVTVVAAAGNENADLAHPELDVISPDFPPGSEVEREVTNACLVIPAEIPGVITVSANGNLGQKSYYSSYGVSIIDVVAPGGDRRFQVTPAAPNGFVLSTFPGGYAYAQGTSMASPHVAGVAALIISQSGKKMNPSTVAARIEQSADAVPCPPNPFNPGPPFAFLAECQGGSGYNSFYGHGQVNALTAVSR